MRRYFCCRPSTQAGFRDAQQPTPLYLHPNPPPCHILNNSRRGLGLSQGGERKELGWQGQAEPGREKSAPNHLLCVWASHQTRRAACLLELRAEQVQIYSEGTVNSLSTVCWIVVWNGEILLPSRGDWLFPSVTLCSEHGSRLWLE